MNELQSLFDAQMEVTGELLFASVSLDRFMRGALIFKPQDLETARRFGMRFRSAAKVFANGGETGQPERPKLDYDRCAERVMEVDQDPETRIADLMQIPDPAMQMEFAATAARAIEVLRGLLPEHTVQTLNAVRRVPPGQALEEPFLEAWAIVDDPTLIADRVRKLVATYDECALFAAVYPLLADRFRQELRSPALDPDELDYRQEAVLARMFDALEVAAAQAQDLQDNFVKDDGDQANKQQGETGKAPQVAAQDETRSNRLQKR